MRAAEDVMSDRNFRSQGGGGFEWMGLWRDLFFLLPFRGTVY